MKGFKILALLLTLGLYQANATGFSHNMNQAQKMLKAKKEVVLKQKPSRPAVTRSATTAAYGASQRADFNESFSVEREPSYADNDEPQIREKMVSSLTQWLSHILMKLLTLSSGR